MIEKGYLVMYYKRQKAANHLKLHEIQFFYLCLRLWFRTIQAQGLVVFRLRCLIFIEKLNKYKRPLQNL